MSGQNSDPGAEVRRIVCMLEKTTSMAEHASLTGSMAGGKEFAVRSYNATVRHLGESGEIPPALFPELAEGAGLDEVGIASAQLAEYLRAGFPEPQQGEGKPTGFQSGDIVFFNIGGLGEIGELIRENLPAWLGGKKDRSQAEEGRTERPESSEAAPSSEPAAGSEPAARAASSAAAAARAALPSQRARIEELRAEPSQTPQAR